MALPALMALLTALFPAGVANAAEPPERPPDPPVITRAQVGWRALHVEWQPPANTGSSPIAGYSLTYGYEGGATRVLELGPGERFVRLRDLDPAHVWRVALAAVNDVGDSAQAVVDRQPTARRPDLNGDGCVDIFDLNTLLSVYDSLGENDFYDLDGDGRVDEADIQVVAVSFDPSGCVPRMPSGYWMLDAVGTVYAFGDAAHHGNASGAVRDIEPTPVGNGYWVVDAAGRVSAFGDAVHHGDLTASLLPGEEVTSISARGWVGYWLFTSHGRVFPFGTAEHYGDMRGIALNAPVLDSVPTPDGAGYYMVAGDGGIFAFGTARFAGSMGGRPLNAPVQSLVPDGDGTGYWLVAADGGIFAFEAPFYGSMGGVRLNRPVSGMVGFGSEGYLMVAEDGGIFAFGTARFHGSLGDNPPPHPVLAVAALG